LRVVNLEAICKIKYNYASLSSQLVTPGSYTQAIAKALGVVGSQTPINQVFYTESNESMIE